MNWGGIHRKSVSNKNVGESEPFNQMTLQFKRKDDCKININ